MVESMSNTDLDMFMEKIVENIHIVHKSLLEFTNKLSLKLPVISFNSIEHLSARQVLNMTATFKELLKIVTNLDTLKKSIAVFKKNTDTFLRALKSIAEDIEQLKTILSYITISEALLRIDKSVENINNELLNFISEIVQLLSSLYDYNIFRMNKIIPVFTVSGVHGLIPFDGLRNGEHIIFLIYPYVLRSTSSFYILSLHEFGHIFQKYYLLPRGTWSIIVNDVIGNLEELGKIEKEDVLYRYRNWIRELFADYFALSLSGKKYLIELWNQFSYLIIDERNAIENIEYYPPLTIRFKLLIEGLSGIGYTVPHFSSYINKLIRENSNKVLAGYFEINTLVNFINFLKDRFNHIIIDNPYNKIPLNIIRMKSDEFKAVSKYI